MDLIEGIRLHEDVMLAILVEVIVPVLVDEGFLDRVGGLEALLHLHAVRNAPHFEMGDGRALARMNIFGAYDDV